MKALGDRVVEGYRIPPSLDSTSAVNFVLTQEAGKLKPRDLKLAIEKNRAEREQRMKEQNKLRASGSAAGQIDLRAVLDEEIKLTTSETNAFQRQLRELAFLADVEEVERVEAEKEFRVSEQFLGTVPLREDEVQRALLTRQRRIQSSRLREWRGRLTRSSGPRAAPSIHSTAADSMLSLSPSFDPNQSDEWSKRLGARRRLIALVSRFVVRQRVRRRMDCVLKFFHDRQAFTRAEVRELIANQSGEHEVSAVFKPQGVVEARSEAKVRDHTLATWWLSTQDEVEVRNAKDIAVLAAEEQRLRSGGSELSQAMVRRDLFPSFQRQAWTPQATATSAQDNLARLLKESVIFESRGFRAARTAPHWKQREYQALALPPLSLLLDKAAQNEGRPRVVAEESYARAAADEQLQEARLRGDKLLSVGASGQLDLDLDRPCPSSVSAAWVDDGGGWPSHALDFLHERPDFRLFPPAPVLSEWDAWSRTRSRRVASESRRRLEHEATHCSLQRKWSEQDWFWSVRSYLLQEEEPHPRPPDRRDRDERRQSLADVFRPDSDRHASGLHCFARDHLRSVLAWDETVSALQQAADDADRLTDSDSDDDLAYARPPPSLAAARDLLRAAPPQVEEMPKTKKSPRGVDSKTASQPRLLASPDAELTSPTSPTPLLAEHEKQAEQVELFQDRRTLDLESGWSKSRREGEDEVFQRLLAVSQRSSSALFALPVAAPFHLYEDELRSAKSSYCETVREPSNVLVEPDPQSASLAFSPAMS